MSRWIEETYREGLKLSLGLKDKLFSGRSPYQTVEIYESTHHGRVLMNDGCFMLSERDERIYHEMLAHVPLHAHPDPRSVLVIGGGDGGTVREVLRHSSVERCVMVEIDAMVIEACRKFLPQTASAFDDPRLELRIGDGVSYVRSTDETFDVILIDSTDPNGAAQPLFGAEFYSALSERLSPVGVVLAQGGSAFYEGEVQTSLLRMCASLFPVTAALNFTNMTYPGGLWSFVWASRGVHPLSDLRPAAMEMFYYSAGTHRAAFQLPEFQRKQLSQWTRI